MTDYTSHPWKVSYDLEGEKLEKSRFVAFCVAPMLEDATERDVLDAYYAFNEEKYAEVVVIEFRNGHEVANVTGDSLWAIVKDAIKAVERRYE